MALTLQVPRACRLVTVLMPGPTGSEEASMTVSAGSHQSTTSASVCFEGQHNTIDLKFKHWL